MVTKTLHGAGTSGRKKSKGNTTYHFRQSVEEAIENSNRYVEYLTAEFKDEIEAINGKKAETEHLMAEIAKTEKNLSTAKIGKRLREWDRKLQILREQCESNRTTEEELALYEQFVYQIWMANSTAKHLKEIVKEHGGDAKRQLLKILKQNKVDVEAYFGGSIVGNHCMNFAVHANIILEEMAAAMMPKISGPSNRQHLEAITVQMKKILNLWLELMKTMKSVNYQSDEACLKFKENTEKLRKEINLLVESPPVPGCEIKYSKQLKLHLLLDGEAFNFLWKWRTLGGVDEQNIESSHPQFNNLLRRFGNSRGGLRQKKMMMEFVFSHST